MRKIDGLMILRIHPSKPKKPAVDVRRQMLESNGIQGNFGGAGILCYFFFGKIYVEVSAFRHG